MGKKPSGNTGNEPSGNDGIVDDANSNVGGIPVEQFDASATGNGSAGTGSADEQPKRKRGRPPGSRNSGTGTAAPSKGNVSVKGIEALLLSIHQMCAMILKAPELMLAETEASALATAIADVARYYPTNFDGRAVAWANLAMVAGGLYGTRALAIYARHNMPPNQPRQAPSVVQPAPHVPNTDYGAAGVIN